MANGPIPPGMHCLHRCDTPPCVRPDHLWLGTNAENTADKIAKGRDRYVYGADNPATKLTAADVIEIRRAHAAGGVTYAEIAERFGVTEANVGCIVRRVSWRHL